MPDWNTFPHDAKPFQYPAARLQKAWPRLHRGDQAVFPELSAVQNLLEAQPAAAPPGFDGDVAALSERLQEAWRCFHRGDFQAAVEAAGHDGVLAHAAANKAAGVYATYLEKDGKRQKRIFLDAVRRAEEATELLPDDPNSHYFLAFNLGRYSQSISIIEALRQGIGGKIQAALARTLELEPRHAEAHTAFGMYHAEIINKVGKMIGGMTYGASIDKAMTHFQTALELTPEAPIAHIEYGNGLFLLFGERRLDEVAELYEKATEMAPADAMEKLDIEAALEELE